MTTQISSYRAVFQVLVLWLAGLGAGMQFAKIGVTFGSVRELYPDAGAEIGMLLSLISFFGIIFGMTAGVLVARFGYRKMLLFALGVGAAVSFWQSFGLGFSVMLASRLVEGISHLIIVVAAPTMIAQVSAPRFRGMAMTFWSTFFGVSYALVAVFGLPFVAEFGLEKLYFLHGLYMLVVAVVMALVVGRLESRATTDRPALSVKSVLRQHLRAYSSPFISAPAIGWLFYTFTFVSLMSILPEYLPPTNRSTVLVLMPLASIAVALIGVTLLLRILKATQVVVLGFSLSFGLMVLLLFGAPIEIIVVALFAVLGLVQGASFASVPRLNQSAEDQAIANGAMAQMGNLGNMLGTPVLLLIMAGYGRYGMIVTVGLCFLAGAGAHIWFGWRRAKYGIQT